MTEIKTMVSFLDLTTANKHHILTNHVNVPWTQQNLVFAHRIPAIWDSAGTSQNIYVMLNYFFGLTAGHKKYGLWVTQKYCIVLYIYIYIYIKVKVKCSRYKPGVAQRVGRGIAVLFHYRGTRRGWVVSSTPRPHFTPEKDSVPILQGGGWAPRAGLDGGKISSPPGFEPRIVQPVVSRSTDWVTRPTHIYNIYIYMYVYREVALSLEAQKKTAINAS